MSLYTKFVANIAFPIHEKLKGHDTVRIKKSLEKTQWLSANELSALQVERLRTFLCKAYEDVAYYHDLFDKLAFNPADLSSVEDLQAVPLLDKQLISDNFDAMKSVNAKATSPFTTGGSSGNPLTFLLGKERVSHDVAEKWRATRWWDVDIGDKEIVAWGSPIELGTQDKVKAIRDKVIRTDLIPAFDMSEQKLLGFIDKIRRDKPAMLFGYPSVFSLIAKTANDHSIDMTDLGIKVVFVTSERLYPYQREAIETCFNAPVANGYGGRDAGFIAHQCPEGGMHISAEDIIVELLDVNGQPVAPGQQGEIVVTHMATSDFPFIRYRTGDIAVMATEPCKCGRGLPMLESVEGRSTDFVVAKDGTMMHGLALIYVLRELTGISEFKIVQETLDETNVDVVFQDGVEQASLITDIQSGLTARLGEGVQVNVQAVDAIAPEKSGKFRYVMSKVAPNA